jgi:PST family polysaccharide transporter
MALYRRDFDFKTLFLIRGISIFIPFFVTIPLALSGFGYWALIIGLLCGQLSNAIILTIKSKWKPKWFYSVGILKEMLAFSTWSLMVSISVWFTMWVDAFIIGNSLNEYYLGLYKTSTSLVNTLMSLITASILPVLFPALSRLQNDYNQFVQMYFKTQRFVSIFVFPMGVGLFLYSDLATQLLLGSQWSEASDIIGVWSLSSAITIVFGHFCSEVYRARGKPAWSFLSQVLHLVVLVPVCIISSKYGFWALVYARSWIRMQGILVDFIIMKFAMGFPVFKTLGNVLPTAISAAAMGLIGFHWRQQYDEVIWRFESIILCTAIYFGFLYLFPNIRKEMIGIVKRLFHMKHSG